MNDAHIILAYKAARHYIKATEDLKLYLRLQNNIPMLESYTIAVQEQFIHHYKYVKIVEHLRKSEQLAF